MRERERERERYESGGKRDGLINVMTDRIEVSTDYDKKIEILRRYMLQKSILFKFSNCDVDP